MQNRSQSQVRLYSMGVYLTICHNIPVVCPFFLALQGFGVLACAWHPHQPWLFTAGSDGRAYLWAWHAHIRKNPMRLLSSQPIATEQIWWRIKTPTGKRRSNSVFYASSSWSFGNMYKLIYLTTWFAQAVCNLCSATIFQVYTLVASWEIPSTSCHFMFETNIRLVLWATLPMKQSLVPCCAAVMDRSSKIMDSYNIPSYTKQEFYHQQALLESWPGHTFARRQCVS